MSDRELVCCKLCARVGRKANIGDGAFRTGYQDGAWLCVHRKGCNRRIAKRHRMTGHKWRGLTVRQAQALAWLFMVGKATTGTVRRSEFTEQTLRSLVNWRLANATRTFAGPDSFTIYTPTGAP